MWKELSMTEENQLYMQVWKYWEVQHKQAH